jgi:hypothetical protein
LAGAESGRRNLSQILFTFVTKAAQIPQNPLSKNPPSVAKIMPVPAARDASQQS